MRLATNPHYANPHESSFISLARGGAIGTLIAFIKETSFVPKAEVVNWAIHDVAQKPNLPNRMKIIDYLSNLEGFDVNFCDARGTTPHNWALIFIAIENRDEELFRWCLGKKDFNPHLRDWHRYGTSSGNTILMKLCSRWQDTRRFNDILEYPGVEKNAVAASHNGSKTDFYTALDVLNQTNVRDNDILRQGLIGVGFKSFDELYYQEKAA